MKPHDTFLALAAAAIDFGLSPGERTRLDAHLAECPVCARGAAALRADALVLAGLPRPVLPERRAAELLYDAMHPARVRHPLRLVAVAALLALLALGSLAVGAELLRRLDDDRLVVLPPATATPAPDASAEPSAEPSGPGIIAGPRTGVLAVTHADPAGDRVVELVDLDGRVVTGLTPALGWDPAWLSQTELLYTCPGLDQQLLGVCRVRVDDLEAPPQVLVSEADRPAPAPDGRSIAVHRGTIDVGTTWVMNADGTQLRELAAGWYPRWRPDGGWLMGQPESPVYSGSIVGLGGEGVIDLEPGHDHAWSPDGDRIAYVGDGTDGPALLSMVLGADPPVVLFEAAAGATLAAPTWLPDDGIVFVMDGDLWRLDAGSADAVALTTGLEVLAAHPEPALQVSPDGRWILFTNGSDDAARVGIASVDGGWTMLELGGRGGAVTQPRWQPGTVTEAPTGPAGSAAPGTGTSGGAIGESWAEATAPVVSAERPVGTITAVTAGGPGFVAVGRGCTGEAPVCEAIVWTSEDGTTWQRAPSSEATNLVPSFPMSGPDIGMFDVAAGDPGIVAVGYAALPDIRAVTWFSPDGVAWERTPLGDALASRVNAVTWDGRQFVAVGEDRSGITDGQNLGTATARAAAWTSPDGRGWTQVPHTEALDAGGFIDTMEDPMSGGMRDVVAGAGGLVAVGSVCQASAKDCQPAAWTSRDGLAWARGLGLPEVSGVLKAVASSGAMLVAVGRQQCEDSALIESGQCPALVLTSSDGATWTQQPFEQGGDLRAVARVGDRFFATAPDGPQVLWSSPDGVTWAPAEVAGGAEAPSQGEIVEWHFAAKPDIAVWLGPTRTGFDSASDPMAWVSDGSAP